ncbi:hypothetical protein HPP92_008750 [Vanilla planifolia]|uniref:Uncharacterized protein n=1 Tax=Vanilla planifolia TaxID=51239 RepID=A0A835R306_VANPL|nr:hypothetical protein HPP92_008750 [Vanilla planifolia]
MSANSDSYTSWIRPSFSSSDHTKFSLLDLEVIGGEEEGSHRSAAAAVSPGLAIGGQGKGDQRPNPDRNPEQTATKRSRD